MQARRHAPAEPLDGGNRGDVGGTGHGVAGRNGEFRIELWGKV